MYDSIKLSEKCDGNVMSRKKITQMEVTIFQNNSFSSLLESSHCHKNVMEMLKSKQWPNCKQWSHRKWSVNSIQSYSSFRGKCLDCTVCDINIAVNGPYRVEVVNSEHP